MRSSLTPTRRLVLGQIVATVTALPGGALAEDTNRGLRILEARDAELQLLPEPAPKSSVLTFDGSVPGPLIRCKQGDELALRLVDKLDEPVTFSVQGLRVPAAMAGIAGLTGAPVAPGQSFDYRFEARDSGLSWYQSHVVPRTADQLGRGLYGALIVDEAEPPVVDRDILILLADWILDKDARILVGPAAALALVEGRAEPRLTVNTREPPLAEVLPPSARLRLRIVSAVASQVLPLVVSGARPRVLAVDGAPCEPFEPARNMIPLGPGALFDVMLDLPAEPEREVTVALRGASGADQVLAMFETKGAPRVQLPPIGALAPNPTLPTKIKLEAARRADLVIEAAAASGHWKLNGVAAAGFPTKPLFRVKRGTPVSLGFVNRTGAVHQMHVHGHYMRVLHDLDDGWEPYWRNTVLVPAGKTKRVAFVADAAGKWPIEGLMGEARSFGLATFFEVT